MPNWCSNKLTIKGSVADLINFLNVGAAADGKDTISNLDEISRMEYYKLSMGNWIPVDESYRKYDTTNFCDGERIITNTTIPVNGADTLVTEDNISDIIQQYKDATKYQQDTYGVVGWYNANMLVFGTKWDAIIDDIMMEGNDLAFFFDTAWSPAINWVRNLAKKFQGMEFHLEYNEPGCNFRGVYDACMNEDGLCEDDQCWDMTDEDLKELGLWWDDSDEDSDEGSEAEA